MLFRACIETTNNSHGSLLLLDNRGFGCSDIADIYLNKNAIRFKIAYKTVQTVTKFTNIYNLEACSLKEGRRFRKNFFGHVGLSPPNFTIGARGALLPCCMLRYWPVGRTG